MVEFSPKCVIPLSNSHHSLVNLRPIEYHHCLRLPLLSLPLFFSFVLVSFSQKNKRQRKQKKIKYSTLLKKESHKGGIAKYPFEPYTTGAIV